jgi:hypothetical protein
MRLSNEGSPTFKIASIFECDHSKADLCKTLLVNNNIFSSVVGMYNIRLLQEFIEASTLLLRDIVDMYGNIVSKLGRNFFQGKASGLWKIEVDNRNKDDAPDDDDQVIFPADIGETDRRSLQENQGTCKLTEKRESHTNWTDLSWEYFRDVEVHGSITKRAIK